MNRHGFILGTIHPGGKVTSDQGVKTTAWKYEELLSGQAALASIEGRAGVRLGDNARRLASWPWKGERMDE